VNIKNIYGALVTALPSSRHFTAIYEQIPSFQEVAFFKTRKIISKGKKGNVF
jgi:hypothetical protein